MPFDTQPQITGESGTTYRPNTEFEGVWIAEFDGQKADCWKSKELCDDPENALLFDGFWFMQDDCGICEHSDERYPFIILKETEAYGLIYEPDEWLIDPRDYGASQ